MASLNLIIKSYVVIHQEGMYPDLCDVFHDKVNLIAIVIASQGCSLEVFLWHPRFSQAKVLIFCPFHFEHRHRNSRDLLSYY